MLLINLYDVDVFLHTWDTFGWRAEGNDIDISFGSFKGFDHYSGKNNQYSIFKI